MTNVINVAEHDYATYIISNAMQADDGCEGEPQIVYQVQELLQDDNVEGIAVDDVGFDGASYQFITEAGEEQEVETRPRYRREIAAQGSSGYWNEDDVNRLLKIYLKHVKKQPRLCGKPNLVTWNDIFREFDAGKKFSKAQIKTKMLRLKNIGKKINMHGMGDRTPWPFWKLVREVIELEESKDPQDTSTDIPTEFISSVEERDAWTEDDLITLLDVYDRHENQPKEVWEPKVAALLGKSVHEVHWQFQKLKSRCDRWRESGKLQHPLENVFRKLNDIQKRKLVTAYELEAEEMSTSQSDLTLGDTPFQQKWSRQQTDRLLEIYLKLLRDLHSAKQVKTRRAIYKLAGRHLGVHVQSVQVKLTSLKGHYKKYLRLKPNFNKTKWRYADTMEKIMRLENAIWTQLEPESSCEELTEPEWFREYRRDVDTRHNENMSVLEKLLNVMQRILDSQV